MDILIIFTGGTIGSEVKDGYICVDTAGIQSLLTSTEFSSKDINIHTENPYTILSETLNGTHIARLVSCINDNISSYDGIIVTHGTDTLQYTAAALGYAFSDTDIPIILVSSNYVINDPRANGIDNLSHAIDYICNNGKPGIYVSYRNTGCDKKMFDALSLLPHQIYDDSLYELDNSNHETLPDPGVMNRACLKLEEHSPVLWLRAYPGMHFPSLLTDTSISTVSGLHTAGHTTYKYVLLDSYHSGTIDTSRQELKSFSDAARQLGISIFLIGLDSEITYETTKPYTDLGINILPHISPVAAYMKLWIMSYV